MDAVTEKISALDSSMLSMLTFYGARDIHMSIQLKLKKLSPECSRKKSLKIPLDLPLMNPKEVPYS